MPGSIGHSGCESACATRGSFAASRTDQLALDVHRAAAVNSTPFRPVLLLAFANERDGRLRYLRNLPREASGVRAALDTEPGRDLWDVVVRTNATLEEILDVFQDARYRGRIVAFHFGGHAGSDELRLESIEGRGVSAHASIFATYLREQKSLKLVFLNGCSTYGQVASLLEAGIPAVIATSRAIDDAVATSLATRFYRGLAGGAGVRVAYEEAAASQVPAGGGTYRDVYRDVAEEPTDTWPWQLHVRHGAEAVEDWTLGEACGEPLLGLPALPTMDLPPRPFRHLSWFGREHAPVFFGRGREIRELYERLTSVHTPPITLLYGQSGVGKSSLLAAGLLPRLEGVSVTRYVRRDRDIGLLSGWSSAVGASGDTLRDRWHQAEAAAGRPVIVVLDQVEECFTRPNPGDPAEFEHFLRALDAVFLDAAQRPKGKLLLGFRKEWLADIEDQLLRHTLPHGKVFVDHLGAEGVAQAITGPATSAELRMQYRLTVEEGLAPRIASDLLEDRGSPIAPALQLLLSKLWDRAVTRSPDAPSFDDGLYLQLKREGVLLDDFVDQQLRALQSWRPDLSRAGLFLDFLAQHTTEIGTTRPRAMPDLAQQYPHHAALLPELIERCRELALLVDAVADDAAGADDDTGTMTRLVHDAVAALVRRRFEQSDLPGQQARRLLERYARQWAGGATGEAFDDADLTTVEAGLKGMRAWTPEEARLVEASRGERTLREGEMRAATVVRALLTAKEADDDPLVAALLVAELAGLPEPAESVRPALLLAGQPIPSMVLEGHSGGITSMAFSPDGSQLLTGSRDGTARLWYLDKSRPCTVFTGHQDAVTCVAFSPDGQWMVTSSRDGTALMRRVDRPEEIWPLFGHTGVVLSCTFGKGGEVVATSSTDGTVRVWSAPSGEEVFVVGGHEGGVRSVMFSPAGDVLVSLDEEGQVHIGTLSAKERKMTERNSPLASVAFSADGSLVGDLAEGGLAIMPDLYRLNTRLQLATNASAPPAGFHLDPKRMPLCAAATTRLVAYEDGQHNIVILDWLMRASPMPAEGVQSDPRAPVAMVRAVIRTTWGQVSRALFDPEGHVLLGLCSDGHVRVWGPEATEILLSHGAPSIGAMAVTPDARLVATGDANGGVRLWPVGRVLEPRNLTPVDRKVVSINDCDHNSVTVDTCPLESSDATERIRITLDGTEAPTLLLRHFGQPLVSPDRRHVLARHGPRLVLLGSARGSKPFVLAPDFTTVANSSFVAGGVCLLAHGTDGSLGMWHVARRELLWKRQGVTWYQAADPHVRTLGTDGVARLLDHDTGDVVWRGRAADQDAVEFPVIWPSPERPWIVTSTAAPDAQRSLEGGEVARGPLHVAMVGDPGQRHLLANDAKWVDHFAQQQRLLVLRTGGDLLAWPTEPSSAGRAQGDLMARDGTLVARDVGVVLPSPHRNRVMLQARDGSLMLLSQDMTAVERSWGPTGTVAWSPNATRFATWRSVPRAELIAPEVATDESEDQQRVRLVVESREANDERPGGDWLLEVWQCGSGGAFEVVPGLPAGSYLDCTVESPTWLSETQLIAPVMESGAYGGLRVGALRFDNPGGETVGTSQQSARSWEVTTEWWRWRSGVEPVPTDSEPVVLPDQIRTASFERGGLTLQMGDGTERDWIADSADDELRLVLPPGEVRDEPIATAAPVVPDTPPPAAAAPAYYVEAKSRDGRYELRSSGLVAVDSPLPPVPLDVPDEAHKGFQFSADSEWLVADVCEWGDGYPWAVRVWKVDNPQQSRLIRHVQHRAMHGNYLHMRRRQTGSMVEITHVSGAGEPLLVPRDYRVLDANRVAYLDEVGEGVDRKRFLTIKRVDQTEEPIVLEAPGGAFSEWRITGTHAIARLDTGHLCVWDVSWQGLASRFRAATDGCLSIAQRRRLLGETQHEAEKRAEACRRPQSA